jgi:hypothetical protein
MTGEVTMRRPNFLMLLVLSGCTGPNPDYIAGARLVFVTASLHESSVVLDSKLCSSEALAANLKGQWIPWISSAAVDFDKVNAIDLIETNGPWVDLAYNVVFPDRKFLAKAPILPLELNQFGDKIPKDEPVWTGTIPGGTRSSNLCIDKFHLQVWASRSPDVYGDIGRVGSLDDNWTYAGGLPCSERAHVLCFER